MNTTNQREVLMHLALGYIILLGNKALELMNVINHPLVEKKEKKAQRRLR